MGITGTDVAKEAADMVLLDDNFATIVAAVEEGRIVYDNLRRFVLFSVVGNIGKVMIVAIPPLLGLPKLLVAIQILFSNLLTDGLVGLGLGVEKGESNVMRRPPYRPDEGVFSRGFAWHVAWLGPFIGVLVIAAAWWVHWQAASTGPIDALGRHALDDAEEQHLITMVFLVLAMIQLTRVFGVRSFVDPFTSYTVKGNRTLMGLVAAAFALQMLAVYFPPTQGFFQTTGAVGWEGLALGLGLGAAVLCAMEIEKAIRRRRLAASHPGGVTPRRPPRAPSPP
jgi:Ca2+-transporting ATPase